MTEFLPTVATAPQTALPAALQAATERAAGYARQSLSAATRRAYERDWRDFSAWCDTAGVEALPATPATLGTFLADRALNLAVGSIERRLAAIVTRHRQAGFHIDTRHPAVRDVMRGIKRQHGTAPRRARAATTAMVKELVSTCGADLLGHRDRALILIGFASALRRSELAALDITDLEFGAEGVRIAVRRSKTDQEAEGAVVGVHATHSASCPVASLRRWIDAAGITEGKVFRRLDRGQVGTSLTGEAVALIVQRRARLVGIDPGLSAHSLRSGLATSAAAAGLAEGDIQRQTRHQSVTVLRTYIRHGSAFIRNVSAGIGL